MRTLFPKLLLSLLAVTLLAAPAAPCSADELKPVVTISFAGYDRLFADIDTIGRIAGSPDSGKMIQMIIQAATQGKGIAGLDTKQPWGAVLQADGDQLVPTVAFLPVSDLRQLVEMAKANPQLSDAIKPDGDVYQIRTPKQTVYATQKGKWTIVAESRENLAKAPADPLKILGDLPQRYLVAARASMQNVPKVYRDQLLAQLRAGAEVGMQQSGSESEELSALRQKMRKQSVERLTALLNESDEISLGWTIDAKTSTTYLDVEATAQSGTKLAERFAEIKSGMTKFAGLLMPNAAVTFNSVGTLDDAQVAQVKTVLTAMRDALPKELEKKGISADQVKTVSQLLNEVGAVVQKTVDAKHIDLATALVLEPAAVTLVAGSMIADGAKLETAVKQSIDELKKNADAAKSLKLAEESYQGMHLHSVSMPTPQPELVPQLGETLEIVLGIADDKVVVAVGRDASKRLKQVIDKSSTGAEVPPLQLRLSAARIAKFVAEVGDDEQVKGTAQMVAKLLETSPNKDHLTLTADPIPRGIRLRLELEEGLIKAIGSLGQSLGGFGRAGQAP